MLSRPPLARQRNLSLVQTAVYSVSDFFSFRSRIDLRTVVLSPDFKPVDIQPIRSRDTKPMR